MNTKIGETKQRTHTIEKRASITLKEINTIKIQSPRMKTRGLKRREYLRGRKTKVDVKDRWITWNQKNSSLFIKILWIIRNSILELELSSIYKCIAKRYHSPCTNITWALGFVSHHNHMSPTTYYAYITSVIICPINRY